MKRPTLRIAGYIGEGVNRASHVADFLKMNERADVDIIVNSPGGDAIEGAAILAEVEAHGRVTFRVRGVAASSASLILCGGKSVIMHPASVWMGHLPWTMTVGDAGQHLKVAALLDKVGRSDAEIYSRFSGHPVERILSWFAEELWLDAKEAIALGFSDALEEGTKQENPAQHDYTKHQAAPQSLQRMALDNGWTTVSSEPNTETE